MEHDSQKNNYPTQFITLKIEHLWNSAWFFNYFKDKFALFYIKNCINYSNIITQIIAGNFTTKFMETFEFVE